MVQALSKLATTLDFEFPSWELDPAKSPNFSLSSTLLVDLELVDEEEEDVDINATLSCGFLESTNVHRDVTFAGGVKIRVSIDEP